METGTIILMIFAAVIGSFIAGVFRLIPREHYQRFMKRFVEFLVPFVLAAFFFLWGEENMKVFLQGVIGSIWVLSTVVPVCLAILSLAIFAYMVFEVIEQLGKKKRGRKRRYTKKEGRKPEEPAKP